MNSYEERFEQLNHKIDALSELFDVEVKQIKQQQNDHVNAIATLQQIVQSLVEVARLDRETTKMDVINTLTTMQKMQSDMLRMQTEIHENRVECRRIWEYLMRQFRNGGEPSL
ncbi:hypothetical protein ACL6C3_27690 [Capilliphycus salinus ALCB114379]|uniref:hypothetical protein n=1 Tax=Capilliphycus salinus TaxID=2768948 RepID=UPI0039A6BB8D